MKLLLERRNSSFEVESAADAEENFERKTAMQQKIEHNAKEHRFLLDCCKRVVSSLMPRHDAFFCLHLCSEEDVDMFPLFIVILLR